MTQSTSLAFNQYVNPVALGAIGQSAWHPTQDVADVSQPGSTTWCTLEFRSSSSPLPTSSTSRPRGERSKRLADSLMDKSRPSRSGSKERRLLSLGTRRRQYCKKTNVSSFGQGFGSAMCHLVMCSDFIVHVSFCKQCVALSESTSIARRCLRQDVPGVVHVLKILDMLWSRFVTFDMRGVEAGLLLVVSRDNGSKIISGPLSGRNASLHHKADRIRQVLPSYRAYSLDLFQGPAGCLGNEEIDESDR